MKKIFLSLGLLCTVIVSFAQKVIEPNSQDHPEWTQSYLPFQIAGNLYYVGTADLACYLITTSQGNILINTGLASSAAQIRQSIEKLGFKLSDIKILLTTQAHYDHLGAMATLKKQTGAKLMADAGDFAAITTGGKDDYFFGGPNYAFEPIKVDKQLHNNDVVKLGDMQLTLLHHPGHTKGSCSFLFSVKDKLKTYRVLIANMPTIITEKPFDQLSAYPNIAADYAYTLKAMKGLKFDIWLASHASQFGLTQKHKSGDKYNPAAFIDNAGYNNQLSALQNEFDKKRLSK